jgi:hypothetical protein
MPARASSSVALISAWARRSRRLTFSAARASSCDSAPPRCGPARRSISNVGDWITLGCCRTWVQWKLPLRTGQDGCVFILTGRFIDGEIGEDLSGISKDCSLAHCISALPAHGQPAGSIEGLDDPGIQLRSQRRLGRSRRIGCFTRRQANTQSGYHCMSIAAAIKARRRPASTPEVRATREDRIREIPTYRPPFDHGGSATLSVTDNSRGARGD